jgi:hypothetical protein
MWLWTVRCLLQKKRTAFGGPFFRKADWPYAEFAPPNKLYQLQSFIRGERGEGHLGMTPYDTLQPWEWSFSQKRTTTRGGLSLRQASDSPTNSFAGSLLRPRCRHVKGSLLRPPACLLRVHQCCGTRTRPVSIRTMHVHAHMRPPSSARTTDLPRVRPAALARSAERPPRPGGRGAPSSHLKRLGAVRPHGGSGEAPQIPANALRFGPVLVVAMRQSTTGGRTLLPGRPEPESPSH